jgi:hypothetical protein
VSERGRVKGDADFTVNGNISAATGLFNGTIAMPGAKRASLVRGAVLQKQNRVAGYFVDENNQSGGVTIEP